MSIIVACLVLAGLFIYLIHQLLEFVRARDEQARETARQELLGAYHRNPLELVDDPREAGLVLLHLAVGANASRVQDGAMVWVARDLMGAEAPDALVARARWLSRHAVDPVATAGAMVAVLDAWLNARERAAFADAVAEIAHAEGAPEGARHGVLEQMFAGLRPAMAEAS